MTSKEGKSESNLDLSQFKYITSYDLYISGKHKLTKRSISHIMINNPTIIPNLIKSWFGLKELTIDINNHRDIYYDLLIYLSTYESKIILLNKYIRKLFKKDIDYYSIYSSKLNISIGRLLGMLIYGEDIENIKEAFILHTPYHCKYSDKMGKIPFQIFIMRNSDSSFDFLPFSDSILKSLETENIKINTKDKKKTLEKFDVYIMEKDYEIDQQYEDLIVNLEMYIPSYTNLSSNKKNKECNEEYTIDTLNEITSYNLFTYYGLRYCIRRSDLLRIAKKMCKCVFPPFSMNCYEKDIIYKGKEYTFNGVKKIVSERDRKMLEKILKIVEDEKNFFSL